MFRSVRARLLVSFLVPTLLFIAVAGGLGYVFTRRLVEDELGRGLARIAASTAALLNGERLLTLERGDDVGGSRTWRNFARDLEAVRQATGARRVFAVDLDGVVRVDAGGALPVGTPMPELQRDRLELERVRGGARAWSQVSFEGNDGLRYKTGYAPVLHEGEVVAVVGVEATSAFFGPLRRLFQGYAALATLALLLVGAVALITARRLTLPLSRLMGAALRIRGGDLKTPVAPEQTHEIGVLAAELESMRAALESRDRQLTMMLAGVAHEVRNPIGGMELFAGLLAEELGTSGGEAQDHLKKIRREIDYLKRIVEDFLAFARERTLSRVRLDGLRIAQAAHDLLAGDAARKGVALRLRAEPGQLDADESLLVSAVANLVKNAIQASASGGSVLIEAVPAGRDYRISVIDAGAGIPEANLTRIFEPFFTTREQGTGLGLPLAQKIAQAHGGALTVTSGPGATAFTLSVPLADRES